MKFNLGKGDTIFVINKGYIKTTKFIWIENYGMSDTNWHSSEDVDY